MSFLPTVSDVTPGDWFMQIVGHGQVSLVELRKAGGPPADAKLSGSAH